MHSKEAGIISLHIRITLFPVSVDIPSYVQVVVPETMHETFMSESEDEGGE